MAAVESRPNPPEFWLAKCLIEVREVRADASSATILNISYPPALLDRGPYQGRFNFGS
jgi:hypothetical protein